MVLLVTVYSFLFVSCVANRLRWIELIRVTTIHNASMGSIDTALSLNLDAGSDDDDDGHRNHDLVDNDAHCFLHEVVELCHCRVYRVGMHFDWPLITRRVRNATQTQQEISWHGNIKNYKSQLGTFLKTSVIPSKTLFRWMFFRFPFFFVRQLLVCLSCILTSPTSPETKTKFAHRRSLSQRFV